MQDLIAKISSATGLDPDQTERAIGVVLDLLRSQGDRTAVPQLMAKLDGAGELLSKTNGSLASKLAGGMMGGPLAAITKLQSLGLNTEQTKQLGSLFLAHARAKAGDALVRRAAANIPGIGGFL